MFPNLAEGGLAMYRAAIVQNQHLTVLARVCDRTDGRTDGWMDGQTDGQTPTGTHNVLFSAPLSGNDLSWNKHLSYSFVKIIFLSSSSSTQ